MSRTQIGILLNRDRCAYSYALAAALDRKARTLGVQLEYLPVGWAQSTENAADSELSDVLERAAGLAGLVMISSVFSHGLKNLAKFSQRWWPRPASSIGYRLPLIPSILVDNRAAMHAATSHLILEHNRKNILFLRGRADSQEANDRYFGFRQALTDNQLLGDSSRVLLGDFTRASAQRAILGLAGDVAFDALIAANDEMALAAVTELERRGKKVPDDVAVVGFDDVPAASSARPPLSTLAQPFTALASAGLEAVARQLEGGHAPAQIDVPVEFIPRVSCGCVRAQVSHVRTSGVQASARSLGAQTAKETDA